MKDELKEYCDEIIGCLIKYGKIEKDKAQDLITNSKTCELATQMGDLFFHETPYYWAMRLIHSKNNPDWHKDPSLWPPPKEYLDFWYPSTEKEPKAV